MVTREQQCIARFVLCFEAVERFKKAEPTEGNLSGLRYWEGHLKRAYKSAREALDSWPVTNTEEDGTVTLIRAGKASA